jgi:hypothetical protein
MQPFAKFLYVILMTGLYLFVFLVPAGMAYEHFITPEIVRGVPADYNFGREHPIYEGGKLLTARLKEKYPEGMPIHDLRTSLIKSGFDVVKADAAYFSMASFPCSRSWSVHWTIEPRAQTLVNIYGHTNTSCL